MNPWYDKENHDREQQLLSNHIGDIDNTQNTVLALFEPDAPGMSADAFPTEESIHFGTRPGRRRVFIPALAELPVEQVRALVTEWRRDETGEANPDPALIDRMVWEYRTAPDGDGMAQIMDALADRYPVRNGGGTPRLPVQPDLGQALNIASADSRGVIVLVVPEDGAGDREALLARLAFEEGIRGRTHMARMSSAEWSAAIESGQIHGPAIDGGVVVVEPDPFGLEGTALEHFGLEVAEEDLRAGLTVALEEFRTRWRKLDRATHLAQGAAEGLSWSEYDPEHGDVVRIGAGSKKLGDGGH